MPNKVIYAYDYNDQTVMLQIGQRDVSGIARRSCDGSELYRYLHGWSLW